MSIDENNVLWVGKKEIGLVYYRTGYQVNQYSSENPEHDLWMVRTKLETSMAIKCPSIDV
jgi:hypothetical protein